MKRLVIRMHFLDSTEATLIGACLADPSAVFYQDYDSLEWQQMKQHITYVPIENQERYNKEMQSLINMITFSAAASLEAMEHHNVIANVATMAKNTIYYHISNEQGDLAYKFWLARNKTDYKKICLFQNTANNNVLVKKGASMMLGSFPTNQVIYVPQVAKEFTLEESAKYDGLTEEGLQEILSSNGEAPLDKRARYYMYHTREDFHVPSKEVMIRILAPYELRVDFKTGELRGEAMEIENAIVHFHGGGFVCMDSASHQSYTRKWSEQLQVPIFSIDYRLAPSWPYPAAQNDCYQAYVWLVSFAEKFLNLKVKKWFFAGDSAGGHLTVSVAELAILRGFRKPDGLFAHYPAFSLDMLFLPSNLLVLDEWLLTETFISVVFGCFTRNGGDRDRSPILSPNNAPDCLIKLLPQITMTACEADMLRDHAVYFLQRLLRADPSRDPEWSKLIYLQDYPHGFNNFDVRRIGVSEFQRGTELTVEAFRAMFNRCK